MKEVVTQASVGGERVGVGYIRLMPDVSSDCARLDGQSTAEAPLSLQSHVTGREALVCFKTDNVSF